jgi:hypothetical protein
LGGCKVKKIVENIGVRIEGKEIFLNNQPIKFRGFNRHLVRIEDNLMSSKHSLFSSQDASEII